MTQDRTRVEGERRRAIGHRRLASEQEALHRSRGRRGGGRDFLAKRTHFSLSQPCHQVSCRLCPPHPFPSPHPRFTPGGEIISDHNLGATLSRV